MDIAAVILVVVLLSGLRVAQEYQRGEVGAENNSTTVLMIPADFVAMAKSLSTYLSEHERKS